MKMRTPLLGASQSTKPAELSNIFIGLHCYPPPKAEGYRFGVVRPAVRPTGCPDFRPFVTNLLGLYLNDYYKFEHESIGVYRTF